MDDAFENSILKLKTFLLACYLRPRERSAFMSEYRQLEAKCGAFDTTHQRHVFEYAAKKMPDDNRIKHKLKQRE